eukprot:TRINITY_DN17171_c0_g3_i1.p1 TRINITY_DN17171_c0_g3~~TRINITY_DN17171_c0_g3_i1.p1  ORF type:complete len:442 (-),score=53.21 TRINITY_DN17171_c0_g3_i1:17-1342(-)
MGKGARLLFSLFLTRFDGADLSAIPNPSCYARSNATWKNPGGVSEGATYCIGAFVNISKSGGDPYSLIDAALSDRVQSIDVKELATPWHARFNNSNKLLLNWFDGSRLPYMGNLDTSQWIIPKSYQQSEGEARIVFVHGSDSRDNALLSDYVGLTTRLVAETGLPLFAFNYATEPIAPWPQNVRNILSYVAYALDHGPQRHGRARSLLLVADSEGSLVAMNVALALSDSGFLSLMGFGKALRGASGPEGWLGGIILSSPVVDVACETPSFAWNCYDAIKDTGDPDTGNCSNTPTLADRIADCRSSYLAYFYGFEGIRESSAGLKAANDSWLRRQDFFEQPLVAPLHANLAGFPPMLLIAGTRDYFYSDAARLAQRACDANVDVEVFNAIGVYHDFIEYSEGCGGGKPMLEAVEAYRRIREFAKARVGNSFPLRKTLGTILV